MNRHERRRAEKLGAEPRKRLTNDVPLEIHGLRELATQLPDDRFYKLEVYFNRGGTIHVNPQINPVRGMPPR